MLVVKFDTEALVRKAYDLGVVADQIPYAFARSLNDAAEETRSFLIGNTWPGAVTVRNQSFLRAALTTKDARAQKGDLTVEIYDKLGRAQLGLHAHGGIREARKSVIAIGSENVTRGARGVTPSQRPRVLKNAFRKGDIVYQRIGKGKNARLRLMYVLKPQATIKQDVPFLQDFGTVMRAALLKSLPGNVRTAMETRR